MVKDKKDPVEVLLRKFSFKELADHQSELIQLSHLIEDTSYALTSVINQFGRAIEKSREQ